MATSDSSVQVGPTFLVDVGSLSLLFHVFYCFFVTRFGGSRCRWGQKWSAMRFSTAWLQSRILIRFAAISKPFGGTIFSSSKNAYSQLSSNQWQRKTVGMTTSIDLLNLERHAQVVLNMMMIIELHINERKIQLSENNGDAIRFYSVTLWLCWYIPAKPLGAFKFSFETNWLKAFGRFAICKLKSLILDHPHNMMKMLMILMMI